MKILQCNQFCGSKYIEFGSGSRVILVLLKKKKEKKNCLKKKIIFFNT